MTDKPTISINSEGRGVAQVLLNGHDISNHVSAVTWRMEAGRQAEMTLTLFNVAIDADGQLVEQETHGWPVLNEADDDQHGEGEGEGEAEAA